MYVCMFKSSYIQYSATFRRTKYQYIHPVNCRMLIKDKIFGEKKKKGQKKGEGSEEQKELEDPLPGKMKNCVVNRLYLLLCKAAFILVFQNRS